jgi:SAM-dependent methyltransferase
MPEPTQIYRRFGREAFGADPASYNAVRPGYPGWVFETLQTECGVGAGTAAFEIGAGTGKATGPLLKLGADPLVAIEPDARLADYLRSAFPTTALSVTTQAFEDAELPQEAFDLGLSATAFHWLDEAVALRKIARLLKPGGWWVALWNVYGDGAYPDPFHEATRGVLAGPASPSAGKGGTPFALDAAARIAALDGNGRIRARALLDQPLAALPDRGPDRRALRDLLQRRRDAGFQPGPGRAPPRRRDPVRRPRHPQHDHHSLSRPQEDLRRRT